MSTEILIDKEYKDWIISLKQKVRSAQLKAAVKVNVELLQLYWDLGADIVSQQSQRSWGDGFLTHLSRDLISEFPDMKGFSRSNLERIRKWYLFWLNGESISAQAVRKLDMLVDAKSISQQPVGQVNFMIAKQAVSQSGTVIGQQLVAQYRLTESLPEQLKSSLPSIEEIEAELEGLK